MTLEQFIKLAKEFSPNLIEIKKNYEIDPPTVNSIFEIINTIGVEPKFVDDSGVVAELPEHNTTSKTIVLRIAIEDPVQAAIGLRALSFLNSIKEKVAGQLCFIFYSKKTGSDFSRKFIKEGGLKNASGLWNLRTNVDVHCGSVGVKLGSLLATVADFKLDVFCKNGATNVVPVTANIITSLSELTSRKTDPLKPSKITISSIHSSRSGAPNSVEIKGNFSTSDEAVARQISSLMKQSVRGLTQANGVDFEIQTTKGSDVTLDESLSLHLIRSAKEVLGKDKVVTLEYNRAPSPDLMKYLQTFPGSILEIGIGHARPSDPPEKSVEGGFKAVLWAFLKYLN